MVGAKNRRRVLILFETSWDRRQLAACEPRWSSSIEVVYSLPSDASCALSLDPVGFVKDAVRGAWGRIDGVTSASDYPGAALAGAIAGELGLPGRAARAAAHRGAQVLFADRAACGRARGGARVRAGRPARGTTPLRRCRSRAG
jgi:hypothetical protein